METKQKYMRVILQLAAIYNLLWGAFVILFPQTYFVAAGMEAINHPMVWQGMGMVVGVYGLGYWWAASDPYTHWPIIAVGFLGKIFGPLGFIMNYLAGLVPAGFLYVLVTNDFIWWIPFGWMLFHIYREKREEILFQSLPWRQKF